MKRTIAVLLSLLTVLAIVNFGSISTQAAYKGQTRKNTYCTVKISKKLIIKKGKQYASVKLSTCDASGVFWNWGLRKNRSIKVTLRDEKGKYICTWNATGGDTLKLGDDHSEYRLYFDYASSNFDNIGYTYQWKITNPKECVVY